MIKLDPKYDEIRKVYYSPTEASLIVGISKHTLFKWESMFGMPKCTRKHNNHRRYTMLDIQIFKLIQELLVEFNVNGVKKHLPERVEQLKLALKADRVSRKNGIGMNSRVSNAA